MPATDEQLRALVTQIDALADQVEALIAAPVPTPDPVPIPDPVPDPTPVPDPIPDPVPDPVPVPVPTPTPGPVVITPPILTGPRTGVPTKPITGTQILKAAAVIGDRTAKSLGLAYKVTDPALVLDGLQLLDHDLDGVSGLMRVYAGRVLNTLIEHGVMKNAGYAPGVARGIFHSVNSEVSGLTIRDWLYRGIKPITSSGDIYGLITLAGKDPNDFGQDYLIEDIDAEGFWADYTGTSSAGSYLNCDAVVVEKGYINGVMRRCRFDSGRGKLWQPSPTVGADGGFDCKALGWKVDEVWFRGFRESMKIWADRLDGKVESHDPSFAHIMVMGDKVTHKSCTWTTQFLRAVSADPSIPPAPLIRFENGVGHAVLQAADLTGFKGQLVSADQLSKGSTLTLPDGKVIVA